MKIVDLKHYDKVHQWLRRNFIKTGKCEVCGQCRRTDWALKKGTEYEKDRNNFVELCRPCHVKYDFTEETREKQAERMKSGLLNGTIPNPSTNKGKFGKDSTAAKAIEKLSKEYELLETYDSLTLASKENDILITSMVNCLKGRTKTAGGFVWRYKI